METLEKLIQKKARLQAQEMAKKLLAPAIEFYQKTGRYGSCVKSEGRNLSINWLLQQIQIDAEMLLEKEIVAELETELFNKTFGENKS